MNGAEQTSKFRIYQDEPAAPHHPLGSGLSGAADYEAVMKGGKPPPGPALASPRAMAEQDRSWLAGLLRRFGRR